MGLATLLPLALALGAGPDSLVQRLGRLDDALYSGKADSVWTVASARVGRNPEDRFAALEAGSAGGMVNRPESPDLLRRAFGRDSIPQDAIAVQAAVLLGSRAILDGNGMDAREWLQLALTGSGRVGDARARAQALSLLAELDLRSGDPEDALARLTEGDRSTPLADTLSRARLACTRSRASAFLGLHDAADSSARAGTSLARAGGLRTLAGTCLASLGIAQAQRATLFLADTTLAEAVALLRDAGAPRVLGSALQWHGYVLRELARLGEAEVALRAAVILGKDLGDRTLLGWSYLNLGLVASTFGDLERARADVELAVAAFDGHLDSWGHHTALLTLAHLGRQLGDTAEATSNARTALVWARNAGNAHLTLLAWTQLSWLAEASGNLAIARAYLDSAATTARTARLVDAQLGLQYQDARLRIVAGQPAAAIPLLRAYLDALPSVPARRYAARARLAEAYVGIGRADLAATELGAAMTDLDAWRASLEEGALRRAVFGASVDDPDHDLGVATVIAAVAASGKVSEAFSLADRRRARSLHDQLLALQAARLTARPGLADRQIVLEPVPAIRAALGAEAALVAFVTGEGREPTTAFVLTADTLIAVVLDPLDSLRRDITRARALLESHDSLPPALLARLGTALAVPWAGTLPASTRLLVLVPDDLLHRVPFALLPYDGPGESLGTRFVLAQSPSVSVFVALRLPRERNDHGVLALGDPELPPSPASSGNGRVRGRLPGARAEVRALSRQVERVTVLAGDGARESTLSGPRASAAGVIHLATHAEVDERSPVGSHVVLAPGDGADGLVSAAELAVLQLSAEVVVLSACRSAGGRLLTGEGIQGITAPLLAAGTRSVVASQWDVEDRATARFMRDFYAALLTQPVAFALAEAQRASRGRGDPPSVWAAFVVVGDPRASPVLTPKSPDWSPALLALLGLGLMAWWRSRRASRTATSRGDLRGSRT